MLKCINADKAKEIKNTQIIFTSNSFCHAHHREKMGFDQCWKFKGLIFCGFQDLCCSLTEINIHNGGYCNSDEKKSLPQCSGSYFCYAGFFFLKLFSSNSCSLISIELV